MGPPLLNVGTRVYSLRYEPLYFRRINLTFLAHVDLAECGTLYFEFSSSLSLGCGLATTIV